MPWRRDAAWREFAEITWSALVVILIDTLINRFSFSFIVNATKYETNAFSCDVFCFLRHILAFQGSFLQGLEQFPHLFKSEN